MLPRYEGALPLARIESTPLEDNSTARQYQLVVVVVVVVVAAAAAVAAAVVAAVVAVGT